jgi:hypothetical protein
MEHFLFSQCVPRLQTTNLCPILTPRFARNMGKTQIDRRVWWNFLDMWIYWQFRVGAPAFCRFQGAGECSGSTAIDWGVGVIFPLCPPMGIDRGRGCQSMTIPTTLEVSCMKDLLKTNIFVCGKLAERWTWRRYAFPGLLRSPHSIFQMSMWIHLS